MSAFAHELAARNTRIDALFVSDDRRRLASAIKNIALISRLLREGNMAHDVMIDVLDWTERDVRAVLEGMEADHG